MKRIYTIILFVISAIQGMAQCPTAFTVTGGGAVCTGTTVTLSSSQAGVNYQLKSGSTNVGSVVAGTGNALTWSPLVPPNGVTYTIVGTNAASACSQTMSGSAVYTSPNINIGAGSGTTLTCYITPLPLTGASITPGATFSWAGPGGFTSNIAGISVSSPGAYTLTVTGPGGCTSTRVRNMTQSLVPPVVTALANTLNPCLNQTATLQVNPIINSITYSWTGPNNFTSSLQNPTVSVPGVYSLTVTTPANCKGTSSVTINPASSSIPPAIFTVGGGGVYCSPGGNAVVTLSGSQTGVNYQLFVLSNGNYSGLTSINGTGGALSWPNLQTEGTYTIVATNGSGCAQTMSGSATITPTSTPIFFNVSGGGAICSNASSTISLSNSQTVMNYQLMLNGSPYGSPIAGTGSPLNWTNLATTGIYTVMGTIPGTNATSGCSKTMNGSSTITVNPQPTPYAVGGGGTVCSNSSGSINLSSSQTGINYQLKLGSANYGTVVAGTGNPLSWNNLATTGTYTVVATNATSSCSQTMNGASTITFVNLPTVFTISGGGTVCSSNTNPLPITLSGSQTGVNYQLISGSANVGPALAGTGSSLNWPVTTEGIYTVSASTIGGCNQSMNGNATVSIYAFPSTTITGPNQLGDDPITLSVSSGSGYTYQWRRDEDDLSGKTGATLQVTTSGNYQAKIMANGCSALSNTLYVSTLAKANYNGLITAMRWRTTKAFEVTEPDLKGLYTYSYDDKYQFKEAQFADPGNGFAFSNAFRVSNMDYDPNGNIKTLRRFDKDGIRTNNFSYTYVPNKNKLASVSGYTNAYTYNVIGQMTGEDQVEEGKDQYVDYNVTGQVKAVYTDAAKTNKKVEYRYDDRGFRLAKKVYKPGNLLDKTTWYIRDASGNVLSIYEQDNVNNTIAQTEVPLYGVGKLGTQYPLQDGFVNYEITDHLGNVRALVREESFEETATTETIRAENERSKFLRYDNVRKINSYLFDHTNNAVANPQTVQGYAIRLRGGAIEKRGLAKSFAIAPGDVIHMEAYAKYLDVNSNNWTGALSTLISQIAGGTASAGTVVDGAAYGTNSTSLLPFDNLLHVPSGTGPKAYLGWLIFDKDFNFTDGGFRRMSDVAKENGSDVPHEKLESDLQITQPGYIYIYLSNDEETPVECYFDDFTVTHNGSYVSQATDYDVWGNIQRQQKAKLDSAYLYRYAYQGQFAERDEETGWSHFEAREYDPIIGKWFVPDPTRQHWSPYLAMGNNPVASVDPDGRFFGTIVGSLVGAGVAAWRGENVWKGALTGAVAGATFDLIVASGGTALPLLIAAGAASGAAGNLVDQSWDLAMGDQKSFDAGEFAISTGVGGLLGPAGRLVGGAARRGLGRIFPGLVGKGNVTVGALLRPAEVEAAIAAESSALPRQIHHFATNKHSIWTPKLAGIAKQFGLDLDGVWNKAAMPHLGRHPNAYHEFVFKGMQRAAAEAGGSQAKFIQLFDQYVKQPVLQNPNLLRKSGW